MILRQKNLASHEKFSEPAPITINHEGPSPESAFKEEDLGVEEMTVNQQCNSEVKTAEINESLHKQDLQLSEPAEQLGVHFD